MLAPALAAWHRLLRAWGEPAWLVCARRCEVIAINAEAVALLGRPEAELLGQPADALIAAPEDLAFWDEARAGSTAPLLSETLLVDSQGALVHVQRRIRQLGPEGLADAGDAAAGGEPPPYLVTLLDRSREQRELEERDLLVAELQATLESTGDGILVTDLAGRIRAFNRRFAQIWGLPENLLTERQDEAVFDWMRSSVVDPIGYSQRLAAIHDATLLQASERLSLHSGQVIERVTQPQHCRGRPVGRVWSFRDHTELVAAGHRIETLSRTDVLTGLANRHQLALDLANALALAGRRQASLALLVLDLDRFKQVNDSLGQPGADRVLLDCADRLRAVARQGDVVARIGGDSSRCCCTMPTRPAPRPPRAACWPRSRTPARWTA